MQQTSAQLHNATSMFANFAYITIEQKFVSSVQIKKIYNFSILCHHNTH